MAASRSAPCWLFSTAELIVLNWISYLSLFAFQSHSILSTLSLNHFSISLDIIRRASVISMRFSSKSAFNSLWIKQQMHWIQILIGITTLYVSGSLFVHHQELLAYIGFGTFYTVVMNCLLLGVGWSSILLLVANGSSKPHKIYQSRYTAKNSWWWAESLPETCRIVIPIKLEFSESVTMHDITNIKICT
jgi:hypothetical protein